MGLVRVLLPLPRAAARLGPGAGRRLLGAALTHCVAPGWVLLRPPPPWRRLAWAEEATAVYRALTESKGARPRDRDLLARSLVWHAYTLLLVNRCEQACTVLDASSAVPGARWSCGAAGPASASPGAGTVRPGATGRRAGLGGGVRGRLPSPRPHPTGPDPGHPAGRVTHLRPGAGGPEPHGGVRGRLRGVRRAVAGHVVARGEPRDPGACTRTVRTHRGAGGIGRSTRRRCPSAGRPGTPPTRSCCGSRPRSYGRCG